MIPASSMMTFAEKSRHHDAALLDIEHLVPTEQPNQNNPQTAFTESGFMGTLRDTRLSVTVVRSELKKKLEVVAASEGRCVAQICDAFLQAGLIAYEKEGARYLRRFLARCNDQHRTVSRGDASCLEISNRLPK
jgi:hypothetical protein